MMVSSVEPRVRLGEPPCKIVGFASRIGKEDCFKRIGQVRGKPVCEVADAVDQISRVGVEGAGLPMEGGDDHRMAMPDVGNVVDEIEPPTSAGTKQGLER